MAKNTSATSIFHRPAPQDIKQQVYKATGGSFLVASVHWLLSVSVCLSLCVQFQSDEQMPYFRRSIIPFTYLRTNEIVLPFLYLFIKNCWYKKIHIRLHFALFLAPNCYIKSHETLTGTFFSMFLLSVDVDVYFLYFKVTTVSLNILSINSATLSLP